MFFFNNPIHKKKIKSVAGCRELFKFEVFKKKHFSTKHTEVSLGLEMKNVIIVISYPGSAVAPANLFVFKEAKLEVNFKVMNVSRLFHPQLLYHTIIIISPFTPFTLVQVCCLVFFN